jgi:hypothetical protein
MPSTTRGFFCAPARDARARCPRATTRTSFGVSTFCEKGRATRRSRHSFAGHSSKLTGIDGYRDDDQNVDHAASFSAQPSPSSPHSHSRFSLVCTALTWKCR